MTTLEKVRPGRLSPGERIDRRTARRWSLVSVPTTVFLVLALVVPMVVTVVYSLWGFVSAGVYDEDVTLDQYIAVVTDPFYQEIFGRTLLLGAAVVVLTLVLGFPVAMMMVTARGAVPAILTLVVLIPLMTSVVVRSYAWTLIYSDAGFVMRSLNGFLSVFGIPPVSLQFSYPGTAIAMAHVLLPLMVFALAGALRQIDPDLAQAARTLGGSRVRTFFDTTIPLAAPGIFAGCLLVFVLTISAFPTPQLVGGAQTQVAATLIYSRATMALNWPLSSAMSIVLVLVVFALMYLNGRGSRRRKESR